MLTSVIKLLPFTRLERCWSYDHSSPDANHAMERPHRTIQLRANSIHRSPHARSLAAAHLVLVSPTRSGCGLILFHALSSSARDRRLPSDTERKPVIAESIQSPDCEVRSDELAAFRPETNRAFTREMLLRFCTFQVSVQVSCVRFPAPFVHECLRRFPPRVRFTPSENTFFPLLDPSDCKSS